jgi:CubicO group peptidase (beta-lactamase class C family)
VVSGQKLEDYFRQHIFAPLKMDDTSYNVPEAKGRASSRNSSALASAWTAPLNCKSRSSGSPSRRRSAAAASPRPRRLRALCAHVAQRRRARRARVLKAETVALMGQNHIGAVSVPGLKSRAAAQRRLHVYRGRT